MNDHFSLKELTFEITKECPMNCLLCSSNGGYPYNKELDLITIKKIINEAKTLGTEHINLSGGEPFIHPFIFDICSYIKDSGFTVNVYTCGNIKSESEDIQPIDTELLSKLKDISIDKLVFSIHGHTSDIHDTMTMKQGSYNNLFESIKRAVNLGLSTELHFVPTKMNYKSLPRIMRLLEKIDVEKLSVLRFVPQGRGKINKKILELNQYEINELWKILYELQNQYPQSMFRFGSPFNCFHLNNSTTCSAGITKATIKADASVVPCVSMKEFISKEKDNNLWNNTLSNIWKDSYIFKNIRSAFIRIQESDCKNCTYFKNCRGGCLTQRYLNNLDERDPYCLMFVSSVKDIKECNQNILTYC